MQKLEKDLIILTHVGVSGRLLHRTPSGYQFGAGKDSQIVTKVEDVEEYGEKVMSDVATWLAADGLKNANKVKLEKEIAESASNLPGTLDALADRLGPEIKANLFSLLKQAIGSVETTPMPIDTATPTPDNPTVQMIEGGVLINKGISKEFVPNDDLMEAEDKAETSEGGMTEALKEVKQELVHRGPGRPKGK